jgi:hypothetical protein
MSDQGDAAQGRPGSRPSEQNSAPDDITGPMPAVSGEEPPVQGFPPVGGEPGAWAAGEDEMSTGGFPAVPPAERRPTSSERSIFEPAEPPAATSPETPATGPAPYNTAWDAGVPGGTEAAYDTLPGPSTFDTAPSGTSPYEDHSYEDRSHETSTYESGAFEDRSFEASAYEPGAFEDRSREPGGFEGGAFEDRSFEASAYEPGAFENRPRETSTYETSVIEDRPRDSGGFGGGAYEDDAYGAPAFTPTEAGPNETSRFEARPFETSSFGEQPPPFGAEGTADASGPGGRWVTAEEQAAENEFFAQDDHPGMWDKVVAPSGPPPQPGKPSSGNLRLPDWMRDEQAASAHESSTETEDEAASNRALYIGVGLLVAGLVAVAAVYVLKGGGDAGSVSHAAASTRPSPTAPAQGTKKPATQKMLRQFAGQHTLQVGQVVDATAGLSYPRLSRPWAQPVPNSPMTELGFSASQFAVTERAAGQPKRWARLMSARLGGAERAAYTGPGTERAAATQAASTFEARMYGFRHRRKVLASQPLDVGGHRGWLVSYYLTFHRPGVVATGDVIAVAVVDTGKPVPGVVFMSVPNNRRKLWPDINYVVQSLKVS